MFFAKLIGSLANFILEDPILGPIYNMDHEVGPWKRAYFNGPTSMVRLLKNSVLKALGPSLGVNQMWTKTNDHAPKNECADLKNKICPKKAFLKINSSLLILLSSLGLHLSSLLVKCVKDVASKSSYKT